MNVLPEHAAPRSSSPGIMSWLSRTRNLRALPRSITPQRLARPRVTNVSYAAVLLGALIIILDAASMGLLVFPTDGAMFQGIEAQSIAIFLASTILCQLVFVLGGTNFEQAQGEMLVEVLPFMQNIANKLASVIPDDRDALLATVVASYVISSIALGALLLALGFFQIDRWIAYFPEAVLDGALGAIGLSLFLSGFDVAQRSSFEWSGTYIKSMFTGPGMPVTVTSLIVTLFLAIGVRVKKKDSATQPRWSTAWMRRITWELRRVCSNSFFTPGYTIAVGIIFWIAALASRQSMQSLVDHHWLFMKVPEGESVTERMKFYEFWGLFKFGLIRWHAMQTVLVEMIVLIIIGALNLPIYYPTLRENLPHVPRTASIQREFIGHGIANLVTGLCGTLPCLIVMSNTLFFSRAGGMRFESAMVLVVVFLFFVFSKLLLPYIPVVCAAVMVFFFGEELMAEALGPTWTKKSLLEYLVIVGTMIACTALGFAQGVGVGLAATLAALGFEHLADYEIRTCMINLSTFADASVLSSRIVERLREGSEYKTQIGVISLTGTAGYTTSAKLRQAIHTLQQQGCAALVVDFTYSARVDRVTAAAIADERQNTHDGVEHPAGFLLGVPYGSSRYNILAKAGAVCEDPSTVDSVTASTLVRQALWPVAEFSDVLGWLSSRAYVTQPRLPRWARDMPAPASPSPLRDVTPARRDSYEVPMTQFITPMTQTIDPTLPLPAQWQACWEQLCCKAPSDTDSVLSDDTKGKLSFEATDTIPTLTNAEGDRWQGSFVSVLEQFGQICFHEPQTLLSSASDPMPDVRIVVVGALNTRTMMAPIQPSEHDSSSNPASKVDRTPADWVRARPRLYRRGTNSELDSTATNTVVERYAQGDVVGLTELTFGERWASDLMTAGHLITSCITMDFSAHDVQQHPDLAMALNTYYSHHQFRMRRIQEIYYRALHKGEKYQW
ncbi:sulfate transporter family protein [Malassezia pachydermatis]|uniref:Sulfate transporter family protein n=1 Tax=Malassezia pachydermatis TaxID=77020 RepID=A0A0M9VQH9_9BASI|nr:sulfate transporter family protein [Malassezia pachydermatis]KOS15563.1 sulfate transporter family protein [Malassezia pachydermatis]